MNFLRSIPARALCKCGAVAVYFSSILGLGAADGFEALRKGFASQGIAGAKCVFEYAPSGSTWTEGLDERKVFLAALSSGDWRLGIGKGGQIYSLRGPFGESVPPQRREAPWIDEVWHLVATNLELVEPVHKFQNSEPKKYWVSGMPIQYFIHQAGIYLKGLTGTKETGAAEEPFYSPLLAKKWEPSSSTLYLVNWAQQARSPNVWTSGLLVQTAYRDIGAGAVEVVQILSNYGEEEITYMNAPWGGVRHSSLPNTVLSKKDGGWKSVDGKWGWEGIPASPFNETGGWIGWVRDVGDEASPALGLVFGLEPGKKPDWRRGRTQILYGNAGKGNGRDYDAVETSCSVNLPPGESIMVRWNILVGSFAQVRQRAAALASQAAMWLPEFDKSLLKRVWTRSGVPSGEGEGAPDFQLYALPVKGTVPVFLMEDSSTGVRFASLDPNAGVPVAPLTNPVPEGDPIHAIYNNRSVYYPYASKVLPKVLLGFAGAKEAEGLVRVELPGHGGAPQVFWAPQKESSLATK